jgi:hypothetical protein
MSFKLADEQAQAAEGVLPRDTTIEGLEHRD